MASTGPNTAPEAVAAAPGRQSKESIETAVRDSQIPPELTKNISDQQEEPDLGKVRETTTLQIA